MSPEPQKNREEQSRLLCCRGALTVPLFAARCQWWTKSALILLNTSTHKWLQEQQSHLQKCNTHKYPSYKYQVVLKPLLKLSHAALGVDMFLTLQFLHKTTHTTINMEHFVLNINHFHRLSAWTLTSKGNEKALIHSREKDEKGATSKSFWDYVSLPGVMKDKGEQTGCECLWKKKLWLTSVWGRYGERMEHSSLGAFLVIYIYIHT